MAVRVTDLHFRYPSGHGVTGVSFAVAPGELFGIVGPNSAGKSTLLRLLSKVLPPAQGQIVLRGRDVAGLGRMALARELAVVPQDFHVAFPFRVREVVLMGRYPHTGGGWPGPRDQAAVEAALDATGLGPLAERRIDELSGGERQLVSIARALAQEPVVLLLDEPTAHLDLRHQALVLDALLRRGDPPRTMVMISHDLNLAAEHCDRLLLLVDGHVQALGTPAEVLTAPHLSQAYGLPVAVEEDPSSGRPRVRGTVPQDRGGRFRPVRT